MNNLIFKLLFICSFIAACGPIDTTPNDLHRGSLDNLPTNSAIEIYYASLADISVRCSIIMAAPHYIPAQFKIAINDKVEDLISQKRSYFVLDHLPSSARYFVLIRVVDVETRKPLLLGCEENVEIVGGKIVDLHLSLIQAIECERVSLIVWLRVF